MTVMIKEGGHYRLRSGTEVGPAKLYEYYGDTAKDKSYHSCKWVLGGMLYQADGRFARGGEDTLFDAVEHITTQGAALLPTSRQERKDTPVWSGFVNYFPNAMCAVAQLSKSANEVHNPGEPLHWSKDKSSDHKDCMGRHILQLGEYDTEADHDYHYLHAVKNAWRAMAELQLLLEGGKPARVKKGEL